MTPSTARSATPSLICATGKLSDEDYAAIDGALRREAIEIMHALDAAQAPEATPTTA